MKRFTIPAALCLLAGLSIWTAPAKPQTGANARPRPKRLLAIGDQHRKDYQHEAVSHALATIERLGRESGAFITDIRTDTQALTKHPIAFAEKTVIATPNYRTLKDYDAVFFYTIGELDLTPQQKTDFLSFLKDDGKGFVGAHSANDTLFTWPEFGEMIGGYFDDHPWDVFDAPIVVEAPDFPAMKGFPARFTIRDEIYQVKNFSRDRVRVLAHLDTGKLQMNSRVHRTDRDFPVAWARDYGRGRVFYSTFGHSDESWDRKDVQVMYLEAIKWAMGLTPGNADPKAKAPVVSQKP
jgi:type 1 glutamine amidotransferase